MNTGDVIEREVEVEEVEESGVKQAGAAKQRPPVLSGRDAQGQVWGFRRTTKHPGSKRKAKGEGATRRKAAKASRKRNRSAR